MVSTNPKLCWCLLFFSQNPSDAGNGMNIHQVWKQGITGKGIVVAVVDDGLQQSHPDLIDNYVSSKLLNIGMYGVHDFCFEGEK